MDLIPTKNELIQQNMCIERVPTPLYQIFADIAFAYPNKDLAKREIYNQVMDWAKEKHPDLNVISFVDYDYTEARQVAQRTGLNITWGMWILFGKGEGIQAVDTSATQLKFGTKQIE